MQMELHINSFERAYAFEMLPLDFVSFLFCFTWHSPPPPPPMPGESNEQQTSTWVHNTVLCHLSIADPTLK